MSLATGLLHFWHLNETSGTTVYDSVSTGGINGTLSGATLDTGGKNNGCMLSNSPFENINFGNNIGFSKTDTFTFSLWFKSVSNDSNGSFFSKESVFTPIIGYNTIFSSRIEFKFRNTQGTFNEISKITSTNTNFSTKFYHVVITYDGSNDANGINYYIDGVFDSGVIDSNIPLTGASTNTNEFVLGSRYTGVGGTGRIDEVAIWNRVLTSTEVEELYADGVGLFELYKPTVITSGITSINATTANCGGNVTFSGNSAVTSRGVCWSTGNTPTISDSLTINGSGLGSFTSSLTGLTQDTLYYVRAYATNSSGTSYGNEVNFTTIIPPKYFELTKTDTTCNDSNDGIITAINASGGTPPYSWSKNGINYQTGTTFTGLSANTYTIYMKDASGATLTHTATIISPTALFARVSYVLPTCAGNDGSITFIMQSGGTLPYEYSIDYSGSIFNFQTGSTFTGLTTAWSYKCAIRDANGCVAMAHNGLVFPDEHVLNAGIIGNQQSIEIGTIPAELFTITQPTYGINSSGGTMQWQYTTDGINWHNLIGITGDTYQPPIATGDTLYRKKVSTTCNFMYTPEIMVNVLSPFPPPFCSGTNYELTEPATCGNSDGVMWIENLDYFKYYDFTLTDTFDNSYMPNLLTGEFTGLAAGWYTLSVMPYPEFQWYYGNEPCVIEWLPVPDINTTVELTDTKIRHAVCGGFGNAIGRIVFQFTDSNIAATGWTFTLYTANGVQVNQQSLLDIANVVYNARPNEYYAILENNFGCTCLVDLTQVLAERLYTVTEITNVYLTPWSSAVEYNYYDNTNDNWYVAGIDQQQFTSSMIAEYLNLPEPWYEIGIHTAVATYNQSLNKGSNGIVYQEEFRISVPHQDNQKWKDLVNVLSKRYIIVFRDAHGFYWTMGFRSGCEVKAYQLQDNQYQISFIHPASQQLLTSMDENYVKYSIL